MDAHPQTRWAGMDIGSYKWRLAPNSGLLRERHGANGDDCRKKARAIKCEFHDPAQIIEHFRLDFIVQSQPVKLQGQYNPARAPLILAPVATLIQLARPCIY